MSGVEVLIISFFLRKCSTSLSLEFSTQFKRALLAWLCNISQCCQSNKYIIQTYRFIKKGGNKHIYMSNLSQWKERKNTNKNLFKNTESYCKWWGGFSRCPSLDGRSIYCAARWMHFSFSPDINQSFSVLLVCWNSGDTSAICLK